MTHRTWHLVLLALLLASPTPGCGEANEGGPTTPVAERPESPKPGEPAPKAPNEPGEFVFFDSMAAAAEQAKDPDALLFVYVGRRRPMCPGCAKLHKRVFSKPEAASISDRWTTVRILGGEDLTPEGNAFMERAGVQSFPTLLAVTAGGEIVDDDLLQHQALDAAGIVAVMEVADERQKAFVAERDAILAEKDPDGLLDLAQVYVQRRTPTRTVEVLRLRAEKIDTVESWVRVGITAQLAEDVAQERMALDHLLESWPQDPHRNDWRMRLATMTLPPLTGRRDDDMVVQKHLEALEGLRNKVSENATDESEIRIKMADILLTKKRKGDAEPHFDWIFENAPKSRAAGAAHLMLVRLAIRAGDLGGAKEHAQAVLGTETDLQFRIEARSKLAELAFADDDIAEVVRQYEAIIEADPDSRAAERARNQLPDLRAELE